MRKRESKIAPTPHLGQRSEIARRSKVQPEEERLGSPLLDRTGLLSHAMPITRYAPINESRAITVKAPRIASTSSPLGLISSYLLTFSLVSEWQLQERLQLTDGESPIVLAPIGVEWKTSRDKLACCPERAARPDSAGSAPSSTAHAPPSHRP